MPTDTTVRIVISDPVNDDKINYEMIEILRPDIHRRIIALAQARPIDTSVSFSTGDEQGDLLVNSALRWAQKLAREKNQE